MTIFTIILIKSNKIKIDGHRGCDGGTLESSEDEEKAGGEGDRELRNIPDIEK